LISRFCEVSVSDLKVSLFPIERIARDWLGSTSDNNFDETLLPFQVLDDVYIEIISGKISNDEFDYCKRELGTETIKHLEKMEYAIVHRFPRIAKDPATGDLILENELEERSTQLVHEVIACLRLLRPIAQHAQFLGGTVTPDGRFAHFHFDNPVTFLTFLPNQKFFGVRTKDLHDLRTYAPLFRGALAGMFWKFRMAIDMYQSGFFQQSHWKARFFLWTAALESLFTSQSPGSQHSGTMVAKERVKFFLGPSTLIYPPGELTNFEPNPALTVEDVIGDIYCLRNHIAHGDKLPDHYYQAAGRPGFEGTSIVKGEMLLEAISSIIRQSLLKILRDNLLLHFADTPSSEAYFAANGLTKRDLQRRYPSYSNNCPS
jgi:hypothetical protein